MSTKRGAVFTYYGKLPHVTWLLKSHDPLIRWPSSVHLITWKYYISWPISFAEWWLKGRGSECKCFSLRRLLFIKSASVPYLIPIFLIKKQVIPSFFIDICTISFSLLFSLPCDPSDRIDKKSELKIIPANFPVTESAM